MVGIVGATGSAILFMIVFVMYSVSGIPTRLAVYWLVGLLLGIVLLMAILLFWTPGFIKDSYQFQRLLAFAHPFKLEKTGGAQLVNSYYAIHNGGLFGVGLGAILKMTRKEGGSYGSN